MAASYCLVLLVLAFFVFSANVDAQYVTVYCQPSDYSNEILMEWMLANGITCQPISTTTTPSISSKKIEVDCGGSKMYVDEDVLELFLDNNCHQTSSKKSNKLSIILGTVIPVFFIFWAIVGFVLHHKRKTAAIAAITAGKPADGANEHTDHQGSPSDGIKINIYDQTTTGNGNLVREQEKY